MLNFMINKIKKGSCKLHNPFRGVITVSNKGQIVIPSDLREELKISKGDKLIVLKRKDGEGFMCLRENIMEKTLSKLNED